MSGATLAHAAEQRTSRTWSAQSHPLQSPVKAKPRSVYVRELDDDIREPLRGTHGGYEPVHVDANFAVAHRVFLRPAGAAGASDVHRGHPDGLVVRLPLAVAEYVSAAVQPVSQQHLRSVAMYSRRSLIWTYDVRIAFAYTARLRSAWV